MDDLFQSLTLPGQGTHTRGRFDGPAALLQGTAFGAEFAALGARDLAGVAVRGDSDITGIAPAMGDNALREGDTEVPLTLPTAEVDAEVGKPLALPLSLEPGAPQSEPFSATHIAINAQIAGVSGGPVSSRAIAEAGPLTLPTAHQDPDAPQPTPIQPGTAAIQTLKAGAQPVAPMAMTLAAPQVSSGQHSTGPGSPQMGADQTPTSQVNTTAAGATLPRADQTGPLTIPPNERAKPDAQPLTIPPSNRAEPTAQPQTLPLAEGRGAQTQPNTIPPSRPTVAAGAPVPSDAPTSEPRPTQILPSTAPPAGSAPTTADPSPVIRTGGTDQPLTIPPANPRQQTAQLSTIPPSPSVAASGASAPLSAIPQAIRAGKTDLPLSVLPSATSGGMQTTSPVPSAILSAATPAQSPLPQAPTGVGVGTSPKVAADQVYTHSPQPKSSAPQGHIPLPGGPVAPAPQTTVAPMPTTPVIAHVQPTQVPTATPNIAEPQGTARSHDGPPVRSGGWTIPPATAPAPSVAAPTSAPLQPLTNMLTALSDSVADALPDMDLVLHTPSGAMTTTALTPTATVLHHAPSATAQLVAQQIASALNQAAPGSDTPLELALDPPELGRVRMQITEIAGAMTLMIHAERPETADLMRRHLELLAQEFAQAGLDAPSVQIRQDGADDSGNGAERHASDAPTLRTTEPEHDSAQPLPQRTAAGGLDLRL